MLTKNKASSDLTKKLEVRTQYANYLIQQQKVKNGCLMKVELQMGGTATSSSLIKILEGTLFTTPTEQSTILSVTYCPPISVSIPPPAPLPTIAVFSWVEQADSPNILYGRIATSSNFATQITTRTSSTDGEEGPYISTDSGVTWTRRITGFTFAVNAYTSDVTVARSSPLIMYASNRRSFSGSIASTYDDIYKSTDGGLNWSIVSPVTATWLSVTCSYDGTIVLAGNSNGNGSYNTVLALSTNGGTSWSVVGPTGQWNSLAMNSTGTRMYAISIGINRLYYSSNSGSTWSFTALSSSPNRVACSADGLVVIVSTVTVPKYSIDGGLTFSDASSLPTKDWSPVAMSDDGNTMASASSTGSRVWVSKNRGVNWTEQTGSPDIFWNSLGTNADGTKLVAGPGGGKVQIGTYVP